MNRRKLLGWTILSCIGAGLLWMLSLTIPLVKLLIMLGVVATLSCLIIYAMDLIVD